MSDEITKDNIEQPVEIITRSGVIPEPIIQTVEPAIEPVPEKVSIPEPEPVAPVITEQIETPPSSVGHLPLAGEEKPEPSPVISEPVVFSPPAKGGELGKGTQVQDSLRPSKSNEWTVPVGESPEGQRGSATGEAK